MLVSFAVVNLIVEMRVPNVKLHGIKPNLLQGKKAIIHLFLNQTITFL